MSNTMAHSPTDADLLNAMTGAPALEAMDRRRSLRQSHATLAVILPDTTGPSAQEPPQLQVMLIDISRHGVGFRSPASFDPGAVHRIRIGTGPLYLESRLRIASCRPRQDGLYDIGAEFI